jgi:hypothetical protein
MPTRAQLLDELRAVRDRIRPGYVLNAEDLHPLYDALIQTLDVPGPDPWDLRALDEPQALDEEREAIQHEPPSVYYHLRHPKL